MAQRLRRVPVCAASPARRIRRLDRRTKRRSRGAVLVSHAVALCALYGKAVGRAGYLLVLGLLLPGLAVEADDRDAALRAAAGRRMASAAAAWSAVAKRFRSSRSPPPRRIGHLSRAIGQRRGRRASEFPFALRVENALISYLDLHRARCSGRRGWRSFIPIRRKFRLWAGGLRGVGHRGDFGAGVSRSASHPYFAVGWLWYLGTLVPVIGLIQVGAQARADRYTYLPMVGLSIMLAWGLRKCLTLA